MGGPRQQNLELETVSWISSLICGITEHIFCLSRGSVCALHLAETCHGCFLGYLSFAIYFRATVSVLDCPLPPGLTGLRTGLKVPAEGKEFGDGVNSVMRLLSAEALKWSVNQKGKRRHSLCPKLKAAFHQHDSFSGLRGYSTFSLPIFSSSFEISH